MLAVGCGNPAADPGFEIVQKLGHGVTFFPILPLFGGTEVFYVGFRPGAHSHAASRGGFYPAFRRRLPPARLLSSAGITKFSASPVTVPAAAAISSSQGAK